MLNSSASAKPFSCKWHGDTNI